MLKPGNVCMNSKQREEDTFDAWLTGHVAQRKERNAIDAYLKVLDTHEAVIAEKLATAQKVREVIEISYETLNLAGDFIRFAKTSQDLFNSLQQLDLPPIELFNDAAIQQEFQEITKKLK